MRIALVIERFDAAGGGRERSTAQIAAGLARRGHDVTVLCQRGRAPEPPVRLRELGRRGATRARRLRNFAEDVRAAAKDGRFDVVHATLPVPGCDVYQPRGGTVPAQAAASLRRRGPVGRLLARAAAPLNAHRAAMAELETEVVADPRVLLLAVSEMVAEEFAAHYGRREGVRVVYNGVDVPDPDDPRRADWRQELRFRLGVGQGDPVFLTVATNFELKGVQETIVAFARWVASRGDDTGARLVVVGRDAPEGYERIAGLRNVGRMVHFVGPTEEVFRYYAAADACVLLSWYDACSRVCLEAARWGIPSITTVFNGAAEVLASGAGIVVPSPRDARAVAAGLDELADPSRRAERSRKCLAAGVRLGMDRHVEELLAAYAQARAPAARGQA